MNFPHLKNRFFSRQARTHGTISPERHTQRTLRVSSGSKPSPKVVSQKRKRFLRSIPENLVSKTPGSSEPFSSADRQPLTFSGGFEASTAGFPFPQGIFHNLPFSFGSGYLTRVRRRPNLLPEETCGIIPRNLPRDFPGKQLAAEEPDHFHHHGML